MEYVLVIAVFVGLALLIFCREAYLAKKREKLFRASLYQNYGKIPGKEYSSERFGRMDSYFRRHMGEGQVDDITWNDLEMDDLFRRMDNTFSSTGEEYLYYTLRNTSGTMEELEHLEEIAEFFDREADCRVKVQLLMRRLGHTGKYSLYDYLDNLDYLGERSNRKHILCDLLFLPLAALIPFSMAYALLGMAVLMLYNIMGYFKEKGEIDPYLTSFDYVLRLTEVCRELVKIKAPACQEEWNRIRLHVEKMKSVRRGASLTLGGNRAGATGNPLDALMDYVKMVFHVDLIQFNRMLAGLRKSLGDVDELISCVGFVETAISVGHFRRSLENGWCVPEFTQDMGIALENGYHPLLGKPVKNSIETKGGVLLTGSNASGKSTFLKMAAVNAILAQTVHTCAADSYRAAFFTICSSMALRDDMGSGESYYIVEIKSLKRIVDLVGGGRRVLCFVDEVLRGTNTVERIAAASQILESLAGGNALCFAATHDIEMTYLLERFYENYHFEEEVAEDDIVFPYQLRKGRAVTRNAIRLLQMIGYDEEIIERASERAKGFVETGKWM